MNDQDYMVDPLGRLRFFGVYSAIVVNNKDPLNKSRVQVQIPGIVGPNTTNWARACLPITDNSYHPDHNPHTAAQIAALLTTSTASASGADPQGGTVTVTVPQLTVVAKSSTPGPTNQLNHTHATTHSMITQVPGSKNSYVADGIIQSATDTQEASKYANGVTAPDGTTTPEHTFHRAVPVVGQQIWVMFEGGDPEYPVWIGVQA